MVDMTFAEIFAFGVLAELDVDETFAFGFGLELFVC